MIVLDSSFLVSFFNEDDYNHNEAIRKMKQWEEKGEEFIVCDYVALEVATVIHYKVSLRKATIFLDLIKNSSKIRFRTLDSTDFELASKVFSNQKERISFVDASVIYLAIMADSHLGTFDEAQKKEYGRHASEGMP
jgi:predicted nucleic acid-binding protein